MISTELDDRIEEIPPLAEKKPLIPPKRTFTPQKSLELLSCTLKAHVRAAGTIVNYFSVPTSAPACLIDLWYDPDLRLVLVGFGHPHPDILIPLSNIAGMTPVPISTLRRTELAQDELDEPGGTQDQADPQSGPQNESESEFCQCGQKHHHFAKVCRNPDCAKPIKGRR